MAYESLKQQVNTYIAENHSSDISAELLNDCLIAMIDALGEASGIIGIIPTSEPQSGDANITYIALQDGTYTNFGNTVVANEVALIKKVSNAWVKMSYAIPAQISNVTIELRQHDTPAETPTGSANLAGNTLQLVFWDLKGAKGEKGDTVDIGMSATVEQGDSESPAVVTITEDKEPMTGKDQSFSMTFRNIKGKSAYDVWLDNGHTGTEAEFLASLKAEFGGFFPATRGDDGKPSGVSDPDTTKIYLVDTDPEDSETKTMWIYDNSTWVNMGEVVVATAFKTTQELSDVSIAEDLGYAGQPIDALASVKMLLGDDDYDMTTLTSIDDWTIRRRSFFSSGNFGIQGNHCVTMCHEGDIVVVKANLENISNFAFIQNLSEHSIPGSAGAITGYFVDDTTLTTLQANETMVFKAPQGTVGIAVSNEYNNASYLPASVTIYSKHKVSEGDNLVGDFAYLDGFFVDSSTNPFQTFNGSYGASVFKCKAGYRYVFQFNGILSGNYYIVKTGSLPYLRHDTDDIEKLKNGGSADSIITIDGEDCYVTIMMSNSYAHLRPLSVYTEKKAAIDANTIEYLSKSYFDEIETEGMTEGYISATFGIYYTATTIFHQVIEYNGGDYVKVVPSSGNNAYIAFLSSNNLQNGVCAPIVEGTGIYKLSNESFVKIPEGTAFIYIHGGTNKELAPQYIGIITLSQGKDYDAEITELQSSIDQFNNAFGQEVVDEAEYKDVDLSQQEQHLGAWSMSGKNWINGSTGYHYSIPIPKGVRKVAIKRTGNYQTYYMFMSEYTDNGDGKPVVKLSKGYTTTKMAKTKYYTYVTVPEDGNYLYLPATGSYRAAGLQFLQATSQFIIGGFKNYSSERIKEQDGILLGNAVSNYPYKTDEDGYEIPNSLQIKVFLDKIAAMKNFKWTPKAATIPKARGGNYTTDEQTGIPYSGNAGITVGFGVSLYTFKTAVDNPYSLMYTEDLQTTSPWANVGTVRHAYTNGHCRSWYGTYCNGFAALATGLTLPVKCGSHNFNEKYFHLVSKVLPEYDKNYYRVGDILTVGGENPHTRVVSGVRHDENGNVTWFKIAESASDQSDGKVREFTLPTGSTTMEEWIARGKNAGYHHYRVNEMYRNIGIGDDLEFDPTGYAQNTDVCTFAGDKATLLKGQLVVINFNLNNLGSWGKTHLVLETFVDDEWVVAATQQIGNISTTNYPNGQAGHAWAIPSEVLDSGKYRCYANTSGSKDDELDDRDATYFEIIGDDCVMKGDGDNWSVEYTGNGKLYGYQLVYGSNSPFITMSDKEVESGKFELHPITCAACAGSYNGESFGIRLYLRGEFGSISTNIIELVDNSETE